MLELVKELKSQKEAKEMTKTTIEKIATDVPYKDKRFTKHDLKGVKEKDSQALKDFQRRVRGEK
jgi:hypothetical protein